MTRRIQGAALLAAGALLVMPVVLAAQQIPPPTTTTPAKQPTAATTVPTASDADVQMLRADIRAKRKQVVAANMTLTADEATKFWPLYDQYAEEGSKINDRRLALINDYAANYRQMSDSVVRDLMGRLAGIDTDVIALRVKYIPEFEKLVSTKKAAQFYQIDRRLDLLLNVQLSSLVPIVNPTN